MAAQVVSQELTLKEAVEYVFRAKRQACRKSYQIKGGKEAVDNIYQILKKK
jgi:hypothetical protein